LREMKLERLMMCVEQHSKLLQIVVEVDAHGAGIRVLPIELLHALAIGAGPTHVLGPPIRFVPMQEARLRQERLSASNFYYSRDERMKAFRVVANFRPVQPVHLVVLAV